MAGVTWNYSENDFSSGKSPPLHNCLYSNVCVPTSTKCARMNMLAQWNEKYICAPESDEKHQMNIIVHQNVQKMNPSVWWQWLVCHALAWWVRCPRPHHRQRSDPPANLDCVTRPLFMWSSPFSPQCLCWLTPHCKWQITNGPNRPPRLRDTTFIYVEAPVPSKSMH